MTNEERVLLEEELATLEILLDDDATCDAEDMKRMEEIRKLLAEGA